MKGRWLVVLLTAAALVVTPVVVTRRPAAGSDLPAGALADRISASSQVAWSGLVQTSGALQVPDTDSFATLGTLLGENSQLRVWWRSAEDWRVDRIRSTGETDLFRQRGWSVRWVFESDTATISPVPRIRLPDAPDLLPPTLARSLLQGARAAELTPLPAVRVAGLDAAGLRLTPADSATSVDHVDVWADPETGLALRLELYGAGDTRPVLTTTMTELDTAMPDARITTFTASASTTVNYEASVDVAAAANALFDVDLPGTLAGLAARDGADPDAVGIYGRGPTTLLALPLRGQVAGPLRQRLQNSASAQVSDVGTFAPVGPIGLLVTPRSPGRGSFLLAGTVTAATLERAAAELLAAA